MNDETPMRTAQAALGFNFPLGLSSGCQIAKTREISALLKGITKIQDYCVDYTDKEIRTSPDIKEDSEQLLHTLGPELWPDREEGKEFPSWLLNAADNPNDHYPGRLYYSDPNDLEILSERFHTFVCLRLANRKRNIQAKARAKNKENTSTRSSLKRLEIPVDEQAHSFVEKSKSCEPEGLDLEPTELQTDKTPHLPPDEIDMRPNIAPTAPMLSKQKNMGDTHSKLCKDNAKCANSSTAGGSTNFGATAVPSHNTASPVNTASSKRNGAKRPNVSSATEARTKRSKCTPNITSTKARTEPTRQQPTQASPPEQDEIFTRPSAPPTSLAADTVDETDHPTIHESQPNLKDQGVTKGPGTAGQSSVERSPSPLLFGRDHSIQDRDEQNSISDDADEHDSMIEATSHPRPVSMTVNDDVGAAPFLSPEQPTETTRSVDEINASLPGVDDQTSYAKNQQLPVVDRIDALDYQYSTELMRMQEQIGEVTSTVNELIAGQKGRIQDADPFGSPEARSSSLDIVMVGRGAQECAIRMKSGELQVGGIETGDQIFEAFQYQFGHLLTAEQEFSIADVDQVGGPPLDCMRQGFWLKKGSSFCEHWKNVRIELGDMCQREDKNVRVTLGAEMYVTNKKQV